MDNTEFINYHKENYAKLPISIKEKGIGILKTHLPTNDLPLINEQIKHFGTVNWMFEIQEHFGWGMSVRNLLREHGLADDMLPIKNWDEYYILLIEDACKEMEHG